jgi:hypothetical protein
MFELRDKSFYFPRPDLRFRRSERRLIRQCFAWSSQPNARSSNIAFEQADSFFEDEGKPE